MQRITVTLDDDLLAELDAVVAAKGYHNRSAALRELARAGIRQRAIETGASGDCVAALVYSYDHEPRELSKRLTRIFHDHHDLTLSSLHTHLDHESCMEVTVLRGPAKDVQVLAERVIAERNIRYGQLVTMPLGRTNERRTRRSASHTRKAYTK